MHGESINVTRDSKLSCRCYDLVMDFTMVTVTDSFTVLRLLGLYKSIFETSFFLGIFIFW